MVTGARKTHPQLIHEISLVLTPASLLQGVIGRAPGGSVYQGLHLVTPQAWDATTAVLSLGNAAGATNFLNAQDIKGIARFDTMLGFFNNGIVPNDTTLFYTLAFTGPAPTVGQTIVWLEYIPQYG